MFRAFQRLIKIIVSRLRCMSSPAVAAGVSPARICRGSRIGCESALNSVKERGSHGALRLPGTWTNGANGMSDIEHVRSGIARVDGNAARVAGASTRQCE
jgi:hypothetical protein